MITILAISITSCQESDDEYSCDDAKKAAARYRSSLRITLSALRSGIISQEDAAAANRRALNRAKAIIDDAACYVSLS